MAIIVLEGPDLVGKSTLARQLSARLVNAECLKQGPPSGSVDILEQYLRPIQDWCYEPMLVRPRWLILDRWHVGELFYGPLLRGKSLLTGQQADYIDMVLQTFGCNFTYVTESPRVLEQRWDVRGDGLIKREWLADLYHDYSEWMSQRSHWAGQQTVGIDHHGFEMRERPQSPMAGSYIGPRNPKVLLLGDERADHRFVFPFVPARATSGHWLMGALHAADVNHMHVGIMNANETNAQQLLTQWDALGRPPVITLGRNAQRAWMTGVTIQSAHYLNHPQHERRFHYAKMERYGQAIKDVMQNG
jgi:hypothetical protein